MTGTGSIFQRAFWDDAIERTVSSAAQGFINGAGLGLVGGASGVITPDVRYLPWWAALGSAGGMAVLTLSKCLVAAYKGGNEGTASFSKAVQLAPEQDMVAQARNRNVPKRK